MAPVVIILVRTANTSLTWQPADPQVCAATRRSPGLTNRMYSLVSFNHSVQGRTGLAELFHISGMLGLGCAFFFASSYPGEPFFPPAGGITPAFPPWQSVQPRRTVPVVCIDDESVCPWQATQPVLARSASSCNSPSRCVPCCWPSSNAHKNTHAPLGARPTARLRITTRTSRIDHSLWSRLRNAVIFLDRRY